MLDDLDRMAQRRIEAKQGRPSLCNFYHEHASRNVLVPESLALEGHLQLISRISSRASVRFR